MENLKKVVGNELETPAGINSKSDSFTPDAGNGQIIGLSVAENYSKDVLSQVYITIEQGTYKPLELAPLSVLFSTSERMFFAADGFSAGTAIKYTLVSKSATIAAANKINLITYHK